MTKEIKTINEVTPLTMLNMAIEQGADLDKLEKLMELQERWEKNEARKAFFHALSEFKKNPPKIIKDLTNKQYGSKYVSISSLVNTVNESMGGFGLNASWDYLPDEDGMMVVTCTLSHDMGHTKTVKATGPEDESGKKNKLQARKSTRTYLKIETFEAVTGMVSEEGNSDDDGNGSSADLITEEQVNELHARASEGDVLDRFYAWLKSTLNITNMNDIKARDYTLVSNTLNGAVKLKENKNG